MKSTSLKPTSLSPKYQVVIPQAIREAMGLVPGTPMMASRVGGSIQFTPVPSLIELQGLLRGCGTALPAEPERH